MSLLAKALHRAGVEAEEWTEGSEAELLVVADPAWETLPEIAKWICSILMLIGRLELFSVLLLFTSSFWKKR